MKISFLLILCVLLTCSSRPAVTPDGGKAVPPHHAREGFRNPYPGFEAKGLGDMLQWVFVDRMRNGRPKKPDTYSFVLAKNDGKALRENGHEFTVTWIGHSSLLVQIGGKNILFDPIWSDRCSPYQSIGPKRKMPPGIRFADLPEIHAVFISHNHFDHLDEPTVRKLGNGPRYFVPLDAGRVMEEMKVTRYREMDWWDEFTFEGMKITCVPAQHFSQRAFCDRNTTLWCGWVVRGEGATGSVFFAGDTGYFPGFREIAARCGPVEVAALPIGAYLPRWFMKPVHMSPDDSVQAYLDLKAGIFVPIHWGTFEMTDETLDQQPRDLMEAVKKRSLPPRNFWLMKHGETRFVRKASVASRDIPDRTVTVRER